MDDRLEQILEQGIASYGATEPLVGLPERILGRIDSCRLARRRRLGWQLALGVGLAGMLLLIPGPKREEQAPPLTQMRAAKPPSAASIAGNVLVVPAVHPHVRHRNELPKLAVFPTPIPLTAEERALMAMAVENPKVTAEAFESLRKKNDPLKVEELVIEPLGQ